MIRMFHGFGINFILSNPVKKFTKRFHFIAIFILLVIKPFKRT